MEIVNTMNSNIMTNQRKITKLIQEEENILISTNYENSDHQGTKFKKETDVTNEGNLTLN